jgi:hypothetical protein
MADQQVDVTFLGLGEGVRAIDDAIARADDGSGFTWLVTQRGSGERERVAAIVPADWLEELLDAHRTGRL